MLFGFQDFRSWEEVSLSLVAWVKLMVWNSLSAEDRETGGSRKRALVVEAADFCQPDLSPWSFLDRAAHSLSVCQHLNRSLSLSQRARRTQLLKDGGGTRC